MQPSFQGLAESTKFKRKMTGHVRVAMIQRLGTRARGWGTAGFTVHMKSRLCHFKRCVYQRQEAMKILLAEPDLHLEVVWRSKPSF